MVVCVECLPADKPWEVVSATRRSSSVAPTACVRVYARVLVPQNLYIRIYIAIIWNIDVFIQSRPLKFIKGVLLILSMYHPLANK